MFIQNITALEQTVPLTGFHPQVEKALVKLLLHRERISVIEIVRQITPWTPIEQLFHLEFLLLKIGGRINPAIKSKPQQPVPTAEHTYRVDFKFSLRDEVNPALPPIVYFVELDGREFHDNTREEFINGRRRLRELQRQGARVYTFAGEEVFSNAAKCVLDTVAALELELIERRHMIMSAWA